MKMDKAKILDKIQKCLRLSKSANANEAATALRHAQKLMEANGITQADLDLLGYSEVEVDVPIQKTKKVPLVLTTLLGLIKHAFGVKLVIDDRIGVSDVSYCIHYFGPTARVQMAGYAHQVVYRAMEQAWRDYLRERPSLRGQRGVRSSFQVGWLQEVRSKVDAIGFPEAEVAATEMMINTRYNKLTKSKVNNMGLYGGVMNSGAASAKDFSIHRPMSELRKKLEKL